MKHEIKLRDTFGASLASGENALQFRISKIDPYLTICEELTIDFTRIRIANSSFINALIGGLFEQHGDEVLEKISFKGCLPTIRVLIESAIELGLSKHNPQTA